MKTKRILWISGCVFVWGLMVWLVSSHAEDGEKWKELYEMKQEHESKGQNRTDVLEKYLGGNPKRTAEEWASLWQQVNEMPEDKTDKVQGVNEWTVIGPFGASDAIVTDISAGTKQTGRVRDLAQVTPVDANDAGIRVLSASGGVWKVNVSSPSELISKALPPQYLGAFAFSPLGADTIWVGSGEPSGGCGMGLFRSNDGGDTWEHVDVTASIPSPCTFHKILYHPNNPKIIHLATSSGYFQSTDWGYHWTQFGSGNITDIITHPTAPDTLYGSMAGAAIMKSNNKGQTWYPLPNQPTTNIGDVKLAISPSQANIIYASIAGTDGNTEGIFKSIDRGVSWTELLITVWDATGIHIGQYDLNGGYHWGKQGYYDNAIAVSPTDPNIVCVGGAAYLQSTDGLHFDWLNNLHEDVHSMLWLNNFNGAFLVGSDGGVAISYNQGNTFSSAFFQDMPITQFYDLDVCDSDPTYMLGGTQDNGMIYRNTTGWKTARDGDGFFGAINPTDPNWMFGCHTISNKNFKVSSNGGGTGIASDWHWESIPCNMEKMMRFERSNSIVFPYIDAIITKCNTQVYYRDLLGAWVDMNPSTPTSSEIWSIAVSNRQTSQDNSNIYASLGLNAVQNEKIAIRWRVDGQWYLSNNVNGLPADTCTWFKVITHPKNFDVAYAIAMKRSDINCGTTGVIYRTTDAAISWQDITYNLPKNITYRSLVAHPSSSEDVIVGTQAMGFFKLGMANGDTTWYKWNLGSPKNIEATALDVIDSTAINGHAYVIAGTYGHGVWGREWTSSDPILGLQSSVKHDFPFDLSEARYQGNTQITFDIQTIQSGEMSLDLYDINGKKIQNLYSANVFSGQNPSVSMNPSELSSGIYVCVLSANGQMIRSRKIRIAHN